MGLSFVVTIILGLIGCGASFYFGRRSASERAVKDLSIKLDLMKACLDRIIERFRVDFIQESSGNIPKEVVENLDNSLRNYRTLLDVADVDWTKYHNLEEDNKWFEEHEICPECGARTDVVPAGGDAFPSLFTPECPSCGWMGRPPSWGGA